MMKTPPFCLALLRSWIKKHVTGRAYNEPLLINVTLNHTESCNVERWSSRLLTDNSLFLFWGYLFIKLFLTLFVIATQITDAKWTALYQVLLRFDWSRALFYSLPTLKQLEHLFKIYLFFRKSRSLWRITVLSVFFRFWKFYKTREMMKRTALQKLKDVDICFVAESEKFLILSFLITQFVFPQLD